MNTKPIGAAELVVNMKGHIYHLDLHPDQLADTVITVGDPGRVAGVSQYFDRIEHKVQHREFITHTGYLGNKRISVVSTGIGPDNIDIVLNELDALANINFDTRTIRDERKSLSIIRLGTSGSLQGDIPVDDVVVSSFAIGLDNLMHFYVTDSNPDESFMINAFQQHTALTEKPIIPYIAEGSIRLRNHFMDAFHNGITVTCPGFYGPQGRVLRGPIAFPNLIGALGSFESRGHRITNFEMETSAIYGLGRMLAHQCLSISTIVFNRVQQTLTPDGAASVDKMIRESLAIIEKI